MTLNAAPTAGEPLPGLTAPDVGRGSDLIETAAASTAHAMVKISKSER